MGIEFLKKFGSQYQLILFESPFLCYKGILGNTHTNTIKNPLQPPPLTHTNANTKYETFLHCSDMLTKLTEKKMYNSNESIVLSKVENKFTEKCFQKCFQKCYQKCYQNLSEKIVQPVIHKI